MDLYLLQTLVSVFEQVHLKNKHIALHITESSVVAAKIFRPSVCVCVFLKNWPSESCAIEEGEEDEVHVTEKRAASRQPVDTMFK